MRLCRVIGPVWASASFPLKAAKKSSIYRNEVTQAAVSAVLQAVQRVAQPDFQPYRPLASQWNPLLPQAGRAIDWQVHRTPLGLFLFLIIGVMAGMFGIGAGWANVPALNLLMGAPLKVSAGTSGLVLSLVDSSAAWVYVNRGAVLPMIAVPSVVGMMLGARIGARLLHVLKGSVIRKLVIAILLFAGLRALLKGLGVWV